MAFRIKGWEKFQHFKDRRPPWIKLYRDILDDPDWHELDGDTAKALVSFWLIASEDETQEGRLPEARRLAFRLRTTEAKINQLLNKLSHWMVQDDTKTISNGYQVDAPETETETETEKKPRKKSKTPIPDGFSISDGVKEWAAKNGHQKLEERLTHFVTVCQAKGYEYADWDAAFRNAISGDWAKLGAAVLPVGKFDVKEWLNAK